MQLVNDSFPQDSVKFEIKSQMILHVVLSRPALRLFRITLAEQRVSVSVTSFNLKQCRYKMNGNYDQWYEPIGYFHCKLDRGLTFFRFQLLVKC